MDLEAALAIVFEEAGRKGQNRVAALLDVSNGTLSKWKKRVRPDGEVRQRVIEFAEGVVSQRPPAPDVLTAAILATGENIQRLAEIRGYAQMVLDQLLDTAKRQQMVVDSLLPWSAAEGRQIALADAVAEQKVRDVQASVRRAAAEAEAADGPVVPKARKKA